MARSGLEWSRQPPVDRSRLIDDLRTLRLPEGADVLVHSSLSRLGNVVGGAGTVISALGDVVGPSGTLLFPTLTGTAADGPTCPPSIDVRSTPCWTGRIPETARHWAGARRSLHPTHSVTAIGASAETYAFGHDQSATPCDEHSPYFRLVENNGWILLLGATQESNTSLHCLEELAHVPYHLQDDVTECEVVDTLGATGVVRNRLHRWRWKRDFPKLDRPLQAGGVLRTGPVGCTEAKLFRAADLFEIALPMLRADPLYLLTEDAREAFGRFAKRT